MKMLYALVAALLVLLIAPAVASAGSYVDPRDRAYEHKKTQAAQDCALQEAQDQSGYCATTSISCGETAAGEPNFCMSDSVFRPTNATGGGMEQRCSRTTTYDSQGNKVSSAGYTCVNQGQAESYPDLIIGIAEMRAPAFTQAKMQCGKTAAEFSALDPTGNQWDCTNVPWTQNCYAKPRYTSHTPDAFGECQLSYNIHDTVTGQERVCTQKITMRKLNVHGSARSQGFPDVATASVDTYVCQDPMEGGVGPTTT